TVPRLTPAILAMAFADAFGLAASARAARWRGLSVGSPISLADGGAFALATDLPAAATRGLDFLRLRRGALRGFARGRPGRRRGSSASGSSGARMAPRTAMVVCGSRLRATTLLIAARVLAGSIGNLLRWDCGR